MSLMALKQDAGAERRGIRRGDRQTRFLAQSVILEEAGSSGLIRIAMITISVVICLFLIWAAVTTVDEIAATSGEVVPSGQVQSIQHLEGGIVKEILVKEGALVEKGQVLIRLNPEQALAELEQNRARRAGLLLQAERLRAIGLDQPSNWAAAGPGFEKLAEDQKAIFEGQIENAKSRRETIKAQIEQRKAELALFEEQEVTFRKNVEILEQQLAVREKLYKEGLGTYIVYLDIQKEVNLARGNLAKVLGDRQRSTEALAEAESRLNELETTLRGTALSELGAATSELAQVHEVLAKFEDRVRRLDIKAPVRGIAKGLKVFTVGGVIPPGAVILEIVPLDKELLVETRISVRDVGHIAVGQPVMVKIVTYDFARYGGITGELKDVSATTFLDDKQQPYYKGIVALDRNYVGFDPERSRVLPGMTVQADITTGQKTLLEYLLKPIYSSVVTSFRER